MEQERDSQVLVTVVIGAVVVALMMALAAAGVGWYSLRDYQRARVRAFLSGEVR